MSTSGAECDARHIAALRRDIVQAEQHYSCQSSQPIDLTLEEAVLRLQLICAEHAATERPPAVPVRSIQSEAHEVEEEVDTKAGDVQPVRLTPLPLPTLQWPLSPITERARRLAERRAAHAARHARREQRRAELQLGSHHRGSVAARLLRVAAGGGASLFCSERNESGGGGAEAAAPHTTSNRAMRRSHRHSRVRSSSTHRDRGEADEAYMTSKGSLSPRQTASHSHRNPYGSLSTLSSLSFSSSCSSSLRSALLTTTMTISSPYSASALASSWSASHRTHTDTRSLSSSSGSVTHAQRAIALKQQEANSEAVLGESKAKLSSERTTTKAIAAESSAAVESPRDKVVTPYLFAPTVRLTDLTKQATETVNSSSSSSMAATCVCFAPNAQDYLVGTQSGLVWLFPLHERGPAMEVTYLGSLYRRAPSHDVLRDRATPSPLDRIGTTRQQTRNIAAHNSSKVNTAVPAYRSTVSNSPSPRGAQTYAATQSNDGEGTGSERTNDNNHITKETSSREPPVALLGHSAAVTSLAFSDDGSYFVSAAEDCGVILWRTSARAKLRRLNLHATPRRVRFMPENSNYLLVVLDQEDEVRLYNTSTGLRVLDAAAEKKQRKAKKDSVKACRQGGHAQGGALSHKANTSLSDSSSLTWQSVAEFFHAVPPTPTQQRQHVAAEEAATRSTHAIRGITALAVERCCEPFFFTGDGNGTVTMWCYRPAAAQEDRTLTPLLQGTKGRVARVLVSNEHSNTTKPANNHSSTSGAGSSTVQHSTQTAEVNTSSMSQQPSSSLSYSSALSTLVPLPYLPQLRRLTSCTIHKDGSVGGPVGELHVSAMNAMQASELLAVSDFSTQIKTGQNTPGDGDVHEGAGGHGGLTDRLAQLVSSYWDSATSAIAQKTTTTAGETQTTSAAQRTVLASSLLPSLSPVMVVVALPWDTIVVLGVRHDRPHDKKNQPQGHVHHNAMSSVGNRPYSLVRLWQVRGLCRLRHVGLGAVAAPSDDTHRDLQDVVLACPCEEGFVHLVAPASHHTEHNNNDVAPVHVTKEDKPYELRTTLAMPCGGECRGLCWSAQGRYLVAVTAEGLVYEWERMYMLHDTAEEGPLISTQPSQHSARSGAENSGGLPQRQVRPSAKEAMHEGNALVRHARTDTNGTSPSTTGTDERPRHGGCRDAAERRLCDLEERGWRESYRAAQVEQQRRRCRAQRVQVTRPTAVSCPSSSVDAESHIAVSGSDDDEAGKGRA